MKQYYMYAVVECDLEGKLNQSVSHWIFKTIAEANTFRVSLNQSECQYVVLELVVQSKD